MNLKDQIVIVVSDEPETTNVCAEYFRKSGCREVHSFSDEDRVIEYLESGRPAKLIVVDTELANRSGMLLIPFVAAGKFPAASGLVMVPLVRKLGSEDAEILARSGVAIVVPKPVSEAGLQQRLRELALLYIDSPADKAFVAKIHQLLHRANFPEAQRLLEQELSVRPGVAKYHVLYLRVLMELAQEERAEELGRKLIPKAGHYTPLMLVMAALQVKRRNYAEAVLFLEKSRMFVPVMIERLLLQAESFLNKANYEEAEKRLRRAEKLCPRCEAVKAGLVRVYASLNRLEEARNLQAQMEDPSEPFQSSMVRGVLLAQAGKQTEAIEMYQRAMPVLNEPTKAPTILYNIALGYYKLQKFENCKEFANRCLATAPQFERAKQLVAKAEAAAQKPGTEPNSAACVAAPTLALTPDQLQFLMSHRFVRPSGLPFSLEERAGEEEFDQQGNVVKKKDDSATIKYDAEALKRQSNIFRGGK